MVLDLLLQILSVPRAMFRTKQEPDEIHLTAQDLKEISRGFCLPTSKRVSIPAVLITYLNRTVGIDSVASCLLGLPRSADHRMSPSSATHPLLLVPGLAKATMSDRLSKLWRLPLKALGIDLHDADELAAVLQEISPDLQVRPCPYRSCRHSPAGTSCNPKCPLLLQLVPLSLPPSTSHTGELSKWLLLSNIAGVHRLKEPYAQPACRSTVQHACQAALALVACSVLHRSP